MTDQKLRNKSLHLLAHGYKKEFAKKVYLDDRFVDLIQELAADFVEENIPVVNEEDRLDLALLLFETLNVVAN